ncbi:hypothetical protein TeGR_g2957, partial [Tetraparma gracilis]
MARNAQMLIDMAASIVSSVSSSSGAGLRNQLYASPCPKPMLPMLTSMVNGAAFNRDALLAVAEEAGLLAAAPSNLQPIEEHMAELQVVLYECLLGSRRVRGTSPAVAHVKANKALLQKTLASRRKRGASNKFEEKKVMPRWVRANALLTSEADALAYLRGFGMRQVPSPTGGRLPCPAPDTFYLDPVVPMLLALPPKTNLHEDEFVKAGKFILQDRSSCLTAAALAPPPGARCVDTCAAPGNKTLHCAALVGRSGSVLAFERSASRLETLERRVKENGAGGIIATRGADFTEANPNGDMFGGVTHVLIDPSCSGSGIVGFQESGA